MRILATSREPIGIIGEVAWRVPSLAVPETESTPRLERLVGNPAAQLFVERAMASQPRFKLTTRNAAAVAQNVVALDGIPLALELAAARIEALSAEHVAERLDQRFRLLNRRQPSRLAPSTNHSWIAKSQRGVALRKPYRRVFVGREAEPRSCGQPAIGPRPVKAASCR